jgi:uncharacterized membrane protein YagU involved in acid resistance
MARPHHSPLRALAQGVLAGALGNAVFTAYQAAAGLNEMPDEPPKEWSEAPPPAQVGQRVSEGVFDHEVPVEQAPVLTHIVHWAYGTLWGAAYGVLHESIRRPLVSGVALTSSVVAADYTVLPAMGLYKPPWRYPASTLVKDYGNHLVYGLAVAGAYAALDRVLPD